MRSIAWLWREKEKIWEAFEIVHRLESNQAHIQICWRAKVQRTVSLKGCGKSKLTRASQTNVSEPKCQACSNVDQSGTCPKLTHAHAENCFQADQKRGLRQDLHLLPREEDEQWMFIIHQEQNLQKSKSDTLTCRSFIIDHKSSMN